MMVRSSIIFVSILVYVYVTSAAVVVAEQQKENKVLTVYDVLESYNFPVGLLPKGATGYELDKKSGKFTVDFEGTCIFGIKSYELKYKSKIKGVISRGKLAKLKGINVKIELVWLRITEVVRDGDDIHFYVGVASADFGVESFLESPQCGCGFHCNNDFSRNNATLSSA